MVFLKKEQLGTTGSSTGDTIEVDSGGTFQFEPNDGGGGSGTLSETLDNGNTTDGYNIQFSSGDNIQFLGDGVDHSIGYPSNGTTTGSSLSISAQDSTGANAAGNITLTSGTGTASGPSGNVELNIATALPGGTRGIIDFQQATTSFLQLAQPATNTTMTMSSTSSNADFTFQWSGAPSVSDTAGSDWNLIGQPGNGTGAGGAISVTAGVGGTTGDGGDVDVTAGAGTGTGDGGTVNITAGDGGSTSGDAGNISLNAGTPTDGTGGFIEINGSDAAGTDQSGGSIAVVAGGGTGTGDDGFIFLNVTGGASTPNGVIHFGLDGTPFITFDPNASVNMNIGDSAGNFNVQYGGAASTDTLGSSIFIVAQQGDGTGNGGQAVLRGGGGGTTGDGGNAEVLAGNGGSSGGAGGDVTIKGGTAGTNQDGGSISMTAEGGAGSGDDGYVILDLITGATISNGIIDFRQDGTSFLAFDPNASVNMDIGASAGDFNLQYASTSASPGKISIIGQGGGGGDVEIEGGSSTSGFAGGGVILTGGSGGSVFGGEISMSAGQGGSTASGGPVLINAGDGGSTSGNGGFVTITAGGVTGASNNGGGITLQPGAGGASGSPGVVRISGVGSTLVMDELPDHGISPDTGDGMIWVRDDSPNVLMFTDDAGVDWVLNSAAAASETLAETLNNSNSTDGYNIVISDGDDIRAPDGYLDLNVLSGGANPELIRFQKDSTDFLTFNPSASVNMDIDADAGDFTLQYSGAASAIGSAIALTGQQGASTSAGGSVTITGGAAGSTSGTGGDVTINGGPSATSGTGGDLLLQSGTGATSSGEVTIQRGTTDVLTTSSSFTYLWAPSTLGLVASGSSRFQVTGSKTETRVSIMAFQNTVVTPQIRQDSRSVAAKAQTLFIQAQDNSNAGAFDGGDLLLRSGTSVGGDPGAMTLQVGTTKRIEIDNTGLGFFDTTPVAQPDVTGSTGANAALQNLLTALANLGLITDSTT